jgi:cytoskeleton protein RodZ
MSAAEIPEPEIGRRGQGPGASLRAAREAQKLAVEKVAEELHLSRSMVEAIERDDYDRLPGAVFVRGYLKNYARLVGLSAKQIISDYELHGPEVEISTPVVKTGINAEVSSGHAGVRLVTWAITLLLVILLAVWWWGYLDWTPPREGPASTEELGGMPAPGPDAPELPSLEPVPVGPPPDPALRAVPPAPFPAEPLPAAPSPAPVEVEELPAEAEPEASAEPAQAGAETEAAPAAEPGRVVFEFDGACWVDIRDSSGRFKLFGEMEKGARRVAEGVPPWSVVLGNSRAVTITVGGEPFDHTRFASGNVARFTLDPGDI